MTIIVDGAEYEENPITGERLQVIASLTLLPPHPPLGSPIVAPTPTPIPKPILTPISDSQPSPLIPHPNIPELPLSIRLDWERSITGLYFSGHPLNPYREVLTCYIKHTTRDIAELASLRDEQIERTKNRTYRLDQTLILGGHVLEVHQSRTKKTGQLKAKLVWEDFVSTVSILVFPKTWANYRGVIKPGWVGFVKGWLSDSEGAVEVFASEFASVSRVMPQGSKVKGDR